MQIPFSKREGKKGHFVYRRRVPRSLAEVVGVNFWKVHLRTADEHAAFEKASALASEHNRLIAELNASDTARLRLRRQLALRRHKDETPTRQALIASARQKLDKLTAAERAVLVDAGGLGAAYVGVEFFDAALRLRQNFPEAFADQTPLEKHVDAFHKDEHRKARRTLEKLGAVGPEDEGPEDADNPRILTVCEAWLKHKGQRPLTATRNRRHISRFVEVCGNLPVREITRKHVLQFRTAIEKAPDARRVSVRMRSAPLGDLKGRDIPAIMSPTVDKHLSALKALLAWCTVNVDDFGPINVAQGIVAAKDTRKKRDKRRDFTPSELKSILDGLDAHYCGRGGSHGSKRYAARHADMIWLVRLAVYSGARVEELAQLERPDVFQCGGIWAIRFDDTGEKSLKNEHSERTVPVHPTLIAMGFINWYERGDGDRVFMSLKRYGIGKRLGGAVSSSFSRYLARIGLKTPQVSYHSLRHSFVTATRGKVPYEVALELEGRADKHSPSHGGYGSGPKLKMLAEWIAKVDPLA